MQSGARLWAQGRIGVIGAPEHMFYWPGTRTITGWLAIPEEAPAPADLIFCFAGRKDRKLFAVDLYSRNMAPLLILSTARFELRRYSDLKGVPSLDLIAMASTIPPRLRHAFVVLEQGLARVMFVPRLRLGTLTEVFALRAWLRQNPQISSVLVVSTSWHLRRIRRCWRALITPKVNPIFLASPSQGREDARALLLEPIKLLLYSLCCHMAKRQQTL